MEQVIPPPTVQMFDYRVTDAASGAILTEGCGAGNRLNGERIYCDDIMFDIPLESEYQVEIRSIRQAEGTLSATQGREYFCQLQDAAPRLWYVNPICYKAMDPTQSELLGVSVFDAAGNEYPPNPANTQIEGNAGDVLRFRVKSHDRLPVYLGLGGICGSMRNYTCLVRYRAP
jgi:hypothetical protein